MVLIRTIVLCIGWISAAYLSFAAECGRPTDRMDVDAWTARSLASPDGRWRFTVEGSQSSDRETPLYVQNAGSSRRWKVGSIERDGTLFWSEDSRRIFLEDLYAADDSKIRVFDVTGPVPEEVNGLDRKIRKEINAHIPTDESTLWLVYPQTCFAANDSSTIIVVADAPHLRDEAGGPGKPLRLRITISLANLRMLESTVESPDRHSSSPRKGN
jgi:hypothetical protein